MLIAIKQTLLVILMVQIGPLKKGKSLLKNNNNLRLEFEIDSGNG
jgi:hypothetical protein